LLVGELLHRIPGKTAPRKAVFFRLLFVSSRLIKDPAHVGKTPADLKVRPAGTTTLHNERKAQRRRLPFIGNKQGSDLTVFG